MALKSPLRGAVIRKVFFFCPVPIIIVSNFNFISTEPFSLQDLLTPIDHFHKMSQWLSTITLVRPIHMCYLVS